MDAETVVLIVWGAFCLFVAASVCWQWATARPTIDERVVLEPPRKRTTR